MTLHLERVRARKVDSLPQSEALDALVRGQPGIGPPHRLVYAPVLVSARGSGNHHGVHARIARRITQAEHDAIDHSFFCLEHPLHVFGIDVETARQDDDILQMPFEVDIAVPVNLSDVAGAIPPVGSERFPRGSLVLPVALRDDGALDQNLAFGGQAHLHSRHDCSNRAVNAPPEGIPADDRRAFRGAITLDNLDAHPFPGHCQRRRQIRSSADEEVKGASQLIVHIVEDSASQGHRQVLGQLVRSLPLPRLALAAHLALDAIEQQAQHLRYHGHYGDMLLLEYLEHRRGLAALRIEYSRTKGQRHEETGSLLKHMRQRQDREHAVA